MIGIEHQRVRRDIGEGVFVFFLRIDLVGGAELLHVGSGKAHAFLKLGCDQKALALGLSQFRFDIPLAAHGQGVGGHVPGVASEHPGDGIPEGRLTVAAFAIRDDQSLKADLADSGQPGDLLHIVHELRVAYEEGVQRSLPDVHIQVIRIDRGLFCYEVSRRVVVKRGQAFAQVVGG